MKFFSTLFLLFGAIAFAQPALIETTLSANVEAGQAEIYLTSATGVTAGMYGYVDRELFRIVTISGTTARVQRGTGGKLTPHTAGVTVYLGAGNGFVSTDPAGRCETRTTPSVPVINILTAGQFACTSNTWEQTNGASSGGADLDGLTGVIKATSGTPSVVTGDPTDCVKVDGSSDPCGGTASVTGNGIVSNVGGVLTGRMIVGASGITITFPDGDGGNPTIAPNLTVLAGLAEDNPWSGIQDFGGASRFRIKTGAGAPTAGDCDAVGEVGSMYARTNGEALNSTFYGCQNTSAGVYAWGLIGASANSINYKSTIAGSTATINNPSQHTITVPRASISVGDRLMCRELKYRHNGGDGLADATIYGFHSINGTQLTAGAWTFATTNVYHEAITQIDIISLTSQVGVIQYSPIAHSTAAAVSVNRAGNVFSVDLTTTDLIFTSGHQMTGADDDSWSSNVTCSLLKAN